MTYKEFLNELEIMPEDMFNDVINSLPKYEFKFINLKAELYDYSSQDDLASCMIACILENWDSVYVEDVDFENKLFSLYDVESLEDLNEIKETFNNWTIENYDDLVELLKEEEFEKEDKLFDSYINVIRQKASVEQLKEFISKL